MAGQSTAKFLQNENFTFIPYQRLFKTITPVVVPGYGEYEGYANRDSLKYLRTYGLNDVKTMIRGTLRNKGFCSAWDVFVQLGCCEDTYEMDNVESMTHASFIDSFVDPKRGETLQAAIARASDGTDEDIRRLEWSGMFTNEKVGLSNGTPAQVLEHILNKKWKLQPNDKDMIVMWASLRLCDRWNCQTHRGYIDRERFQLGGYRDGEDCRPAVGYCSEVAGGREDLAERSCYTRRRKKFMIQFSRS